MTDKKNWDDIPSLDGLEIDWEFEPENPLGRRAFVRMQSRAVSMILEVKQIPAQFICKSGKHNAVVLDISQGGLKIKTNGELESKELIKVGFLLSDKKVLVKATVVYVDKSGDYPIAGLEFVDLNKEDSEYIASLYSSINYGK